MSLREHVAYRLFEKVDDQTALHQGGRLFQQWLVDQRAKCEQEQLRWVAKNQKKLRAELYHGISDALLNEETITLDEGEVFVSEYYRATGTLVHPDRRPGYGHFLNQVGKQVFLPDSHVGSPRNMYKHYQESMVIVQEYGKPDAFITMTCNPKWVEIIVLLPHDQTAQDHPDIVARVWQLKLKAKLADLGKGLLGRLEARIYVVKFQKRGLPHAHIVIIVDEEDKPRTREIIDKLVSAEVPDKEVNPKLYETVMTSIKYLYKYVYKGSDRDILTIEAVRDSCEPRLEPNKILRFLNARYISPVEAAMRLLTYEIQGKTHAVTTLTVHLEGGQMVVFQPNDDPDRVLGRAGSTMLTSFYELCASTEPEDEIAKTMLHQEIPKEQKYGFDAKSTKRLLGV
ncbi:unnamed protein product [Phytophthora fragariaefolia]|uniref:Unnamed protein product n=1 Tax=Phytophthora fragariaefolia TaxID=1490495 RepID=A0A9W6YA76_9STRA|nr:unnamed protein product [Phytophthora fragariaefolia]